MKEITKETQDKIDEILKSHGCVDSDRAQSAMQELAQHLTRIIEDAQRIAFDAARETKNGTGQEYRTGEFGVTRLVTVEKEVYNFKSFDDYKTKLSCK